VIVAHNASELREEQPDFWRAVQKDPMLETRVLETASGGILISTKRR
jgi:hypothetical protein